MGVVLDVGNDQGEVGKRRRSQIAGKLGERHDVRDLGLASLRAQIGIVAQDTFLFNDTVARNIAYGLPDVSIERIREAAETALAHEFIQRLPEGYATIVGDRGVRLLLVAQRVQHFFDVLAAIVE